LSNEYSARQLDTDVEPVKKWRKRWLAAYAELLTFEQGFDGLPVKDSHLLRRLLSVLQDAIGRTLTSKPRTADRQLKGTSAHPSALKFL
jgi:hypothetical protein